MKSVRLLLYQLVLVLLSFPSNIGAAHGHDIPIYRYQVINIFPHDINAFTQGLFHKDSYFYESTGRYGHSSIRKVEIETGRVIQSVALPDHVFGEGITGFKGKILGLTWRSGVGFVWDVQDFRQEKIFDYEGEGWGLTTDNQSLYMSDGTSIIKVLDPATLEETRRIRVTANEQPVVNLNELEWVKGELYANIWQSETIARIDPVTGNIVGWINLTGLSPVKPGVDNVLNGIAYSDDGRLFVTGKLWPNVFEIKLIAP